MEPPLSRPPGAAPCPVCGGLCTRVPDMPSDHRNPFLGAPMPKQPEQPKRPKGKRRPAEDRARRPVEDR